MTLEDFFTLTEMKNGLATLVRVEELIVAMHNQKDYVMSNVSDAARQWSTVAGTIAATENKDCLNHFVQLNGLCFLDQWLQEALKHSNAGSDSTVEELINALLGSLERLPMDREQSTASGIWLTVAQLQGHKNVSIKERARILFEKWNHASVNDIGCQTTEREGTCQDDQPKPSADASTTEGISPCIAGTKEERCGVESARTESHHSNVTRCSDSSQSDAVDDGNISISNQLMPTSSLNSADANALLGDMNSMGSSLVSNSCEENISITKESSACPAVGMASGTCSLSIAMQREHDDQCDASVLKNVDGAKVMEVEVNTKDGSICKSSYKESSNVSSSSGLSASVPAQKPVMEPTLSCNLDSKKSKFCISKIVEPQPRSMGVDCGLAKYLPTMRELKAVVHVLKGSQDLSINRYKLRKIDDPESSFHKKEAVGSATDVKEDGSEANLKLSNGVDPMPKTVEINASDERDQKSELGLECGEIDALEVARQVAIEVEREVVDYREPFCCSSPEVNSGEIMDLRSPDYVEDKQDQPVTEELTRNRSLSCKDLSDRASSPKDGSLRISDKTGIDPGNCVQDMRLPELTKLAQESDGKIDRNICDFDLNEDVCDEEFDCPLNPIPNNTVNLSVPIAVAASKGAPVLPGTPLQFEGELGWRGSAATSAFRPASPRRTPDSEKTCSASKHKTNFLQIDLNVAESEDDVAIDPTSAKQIPVSSGFPSGDSSVEVSSRRAERLKLDLNRLGDEDVPPHPSSYWRLLQQNGDQSLSPASSSSSRQPSMRDFDLNDSPSFLSAAGSHNLSKSSSKASGTYGSSKLDDPVITIMGSRMTVVDRKDYANGAQQSFLGNGPSMEPTAPMLPYPHMPPAAYGYNGLAAEPSMPFPPALYGPGSIPYMVDSRGAPVIPQILGSAGLNGAHSATPPFLMSITSAPSSLNGVGSSRFCLDLNSGMPSVETGSREAGSSKQLFMQGHYGLVEEKAVAAPQPVISGMTLKRKEPDCGWEPYAFGYKQVI